MNLEAPATPAPWLALVQRWLPVLACVVAGLLVVFVLADYALAPLYLAFAESNLQLLADVYLRVAGVLWWGLIAASWALAAALVVRWRHETGQGRGALRLAGVGLILTWSWQLFDRLLLGWLFDTYAQGPDLPDWLVLVGSVAGVVRQVLDLVSAGLLMAGAVRLRRGR